MIHRSLFVLAAIVLSLERVAYAVIWHKPHAYRGWCRWLPPHGHDPVSTLTRLFVGFKILQAMVFGTWCYVHGNGVLLPAGTSAWSLAPGLGLILIGQVLNTAVFVRLGRTGVFYGNRLGRYVPWCDGFPFSACRHPQYVGTVMSIWGFFLIMRFPAPDWIALPALETVYYLVGAAFEQERPRSLQTS